MSGELFATLPAAGLVAGVDEAGRGPLAGPVAAAAVILDPAFPVAGLADSKALSAQRREELAYAIRRYALAWCVCFSEVAEIDELNILHATMAAMRRAVRALEPVPGLVLVDGNRCPPLPCAARPEVGGDARIACISAASILAKVARDARMRELDRCYPQYGFARHKGYATAQHRAALVRFGPSPEHRRSFAPVRAAYDAGACA